MWKRWIAALLTALCSLMLLPAQAAVPTYACTRAFTDALREAGVFYEVEGVDEDGDELVSIDRWSFTLNCYFSEDGQDMSILIWYLSSYDPSQLDDVLMICSRLNSESRGVCFYADESDNTITASMDVILREEDADEVALEAVEYLLELLPEAKGALTLPTVMTDAALPTVTPAPTARPQATPRPTAAPDPAAQQTVPPQPEAAEVIITADTARIRSGPNTTSAYVLTAHRGDSFPLIGVSGDWYIIDCNGRAAFVSMSVATAE